MSDPMRLQEELAKVEQAIVAQEALRGILPEAQLETVLTALREKRQALLVALQGSGAVAVGRDARAAAERAAIARDVRGHLITGDHVTIGADPAQAEAERAETRYLRRLRQRCNVLPLAAMGGDETVGDEVSLEEVYVALDTRTQVPLTEAERKERRERASFRDREDTRLLTVLEAATAAPYLVLLGDPGSGKSTFVRQLAAWLAAARLKEREPLSGWSPDLVPAGDAPGRDGAAVSEQSAGRLQGRGLGRRPGGCADGGARAVDI